MNDCVYPIISDLGTFIRIYRAAGIEHSFWRVKERLNGELFDGYSLTVGKSLDNDCPSTEMVFDLNGSLVEHCSSFYTRRSGVSAITTRGATNVRYLGKPF